MRISKNIHPDELRHNYCLESHNTRLQIYMCNMKTDISCDMCTTVVRDNSLIQKIWTRMTMCFFIEWGNKKYFKQWIF